MKRQQQQQQKMSKRTKNYAARDHKPTIITNKRIGMSRMRSVLSCSHITNGNSLKTKKQCLVYYTLHMDHHYIYLSNRQSFCSVMVRVSLLTHSHSLSPARFIMIHSNACYTTCTLRRHLY